MKVRYKCSCQNRVTWSDLNCCTQCHSLSCFSCQDFRPVLKYCPKCLEEPAKTDQIFCNRNCFQCPRCSISLVISSEKVGEEMKQYTFNCTGCKWNFVTPPTGRIKSLTKYILELYNSQHARAYEIMTHLLNKKHLLQLEGKSFNFTQSEPSPEGYSSKSITQRLIVGEKLHNLINEQIPLPFEEDKKTELYPKRTHLKCRYIYSCPNCHNTMSVPDQRPGSSRLMKDSFAMNILPHIRIESASKVLGTTTDDDTLAIVFVNATPSKPVEFSLTASESLFLPIRGFILPSVSNDTNSHTNTEGKDVNLQILEDYIKYVPTYLLGKDNKLSQAERTRRMGSMFSFRNNNGIKIQQLAPGDDEDVQPLDQGDAWCALPLKVTKKGTHQLNLLTKIDDWEVNLELFF
ncbi:HGL300Wp [Eremothecium sinecaudum]|uniref:Dynactin subunit 4 n=1 Tax=Eremothecium sinecaudum TaxID=45286 RepID=A0A0X8HVA0_9SACH|nr:HGL300Wp [Eremothecium sinecaudum]AMD22040.1 HGL300Wp [Eremothecium sinecaudum]